MNLAELSGLIGCDEEELKEVLFREKSIKVFSSKFPLSDEIEEFLRNYVASKKPNASENDKVLKEIQDIFFADSQRNLLIRCIKNGYHIIIDTSSILRKHDAFIRFYSECRPLLEHYGRKLEIPYAVMVELAIIARSNDKDAETVSRAKNVIDLLQSEIECGRVIVLGNRNDTWKNERGTNSYFADADLTVQILAWRNNGENVLFITQDYTMSLDVIKISKVKSVKSNAKVIVKKLDAYGSLTEAL